jgi:hypothetical protein
LIGYDVDHENNGYFLPEHDIDQPLHQLPFHRGYHWGGYLDPIRKRLDAIEKDFDGICDLDMTEDLGPQEHLVVYLDQLSNLALKKLMAVRNPGEPCWPLYDSSVARYESAGNEYRRRLSIYRHQSVGGHASTPGP